MTSFMVFTENREMVNLLTDKDAGKLLKALMDHAAGDEPKEMPKAAQVLYMVMAGQADRMEEQYQEAARKRSEAGRKAGKASARQRTSTNVDEGQPTNTNTNTNTNTKIIHAPVKKNSFFDFEQRTDVDLDAIVRAER